MKHNKTTMFFYIGLAVTLLFNIWMADQIPYTHDDWDWGLQPGIQHLIQADINSRYAGNLIEVVLTRSPLLKTLVMGGTFTLIFILSMIFTCKCIDSMQSEKDSLSVKAGVFLLGCFLMLAMPADIWQQTNGWVAGFSNFVVSGLGLLVFGLIVVDTVQEDEPDRINRDRSKKGCKIFTAVCFAFGFVIQLFLENLTVYFCICSAAFFIYTIIKKKRAKLEAGALLSGNIIGFLVMFSSGMYHTLWDTGFAVGNYRELMYDKSKPFYVFVIDACKRYFGEFVPTIISHHAILTCAIAALLFLLSLRKEKNSRDKGHKPMVCLFVSGLDVLFFFYYFICHIQKSAAAIDHISSMRILIDLLFICFVTLEIAYLFLDNKRRLFCLYVVWLPPFILMSPMVVINTVGPRSYYTAVLCLTVFCQLLLAIWLLGERQKIRTISIAICFVLAVLIAAKMALIYNEIGHVNRERLQMIRHATETQQQSICLPTYPYAQYLWCPDPMNDKRVEYFRSFYGIPSEMELIFKK